MIQCPYCNTALTETSPSCPVCHLSIERANAVMGPVPLLSDTGLTDLTGSLPPRAAKQLRQALHSFHGRFPQCRVFVLLNHFSPTFPPASHLFWLFNAAGLSHAGSKRSLNRDILIGIDPARRWAGFIIGYGLEPFLGQEALDHVLDLATPRLEAGRIAEAVLDILTRLGALMEGVCRELPVTLGLRTTLALETSSTDY